VADKKLTPWQRYKEKLGDARPWDILNPYSDRVEKSVADARFEHCLSCEYLFVPTKQCRQCGCFMNIKTQLANAECPIGKWGKYKAD
jgi:hypothetical protein